MLARTSHDEKEVHRALICKDKSGHAGLRVQAVATPQPSGKKVLVQVLAAGLNYPDVLITQGRYQFQPPYPFTPGGELCGVVLACGEECSGKVKVGQKVIAMCGWGAFQEKVIVSEDECVVAPPDVAPEVAAGFLFTYGTTIHALKDRGEIKPGETCLILGAGGGVGIAAIEICKALGATVIACASTQDKLDMCKRFGADYCINYTKEKLKDTVMKYTHSKGVDVVYDAVGGEHAEPAIRSMAWRGRYLVIGFVGGIPKIPLNLTLLKGCSIVGVFWGSFTNREPQNYEHDIQLLFTWLKEGKLKPSSTQVFSLDQAAQGIGMLEDRKIIGKAIVKLSQDARL